MAERAEKTLAKTRSRDNLQAFTKLTEVVDGVRRIREDPPLLIRVDASEGDMPAIVRKAFADYKSTLVDDRRALVDRYGFVDMARKVVGVGSVGTLCLIVLLIGPGRRRPALPADSSRPADRCSRRISAVRRSATPDTASSPASG